MKRLLILLVAITTITVIIAQERSQVSMKIPSGVIHNESPPHNEPHKLLTEKQIKIPEVKVDRDITYVPIGQAGNALSTARNSRTYLWADPNINSVVYTHRMTGGVYNNSRIAYDVSTDGGVNFETNLQVYNPMCGNPGQYDYYPARYPQGGIINPVGNTNPDNAYYTYLGAITGGYAGNVNWGMYSYGINALTQTNPPEPTQDFLFSEGDFCKYIPSAFTITQDGITWFVDGNYCYNSSSYEYDYNGKLTIGRGEIVNDTILYEETLIYFLTQSDTINDHKIAFSPSGQIGYILILGLSVIDPLPFTNYHPILLKTTDGGETWSDPIHIKLGGIDGIQSIKQYWSDETIDTIAYYGSGFNRDEVFYNMGYHADIIVDTYGNPHITGIIGIATDEGWFPYEGTMATWHVFSQDGGVTWEANALIDNYFLEGEFGTGYTVKQYNRPYAASYMDGETLLFSWIDTDLDGATGNTNPNIFCISYSPVCETYSNWGVENVTQLGLYWFSAFYGCMSQYFFIDQSNWWGEYNVPFAFLEFTVPGDPYSPVNYWYINGYSFHDPCITGMEENHNYYDFTVSQNSPNPAVVGTDIMVTTDIPGIIKLTVINILGQAIHHESVNNSALTHCFTVDVHDFKPGIYFYSIEIKGKVITKKMVVR